MYKKGRVVNGAKMAVNTIIRIVNKVAFSNIRFDLGLHVFVPDLDNIKLDYAIPKIREIKVHATRCADEGTVSDNERN